jgi:transcriptional regulator with XRE-family HTH domain
MLTETLTTGLAQYSIGPKIRALRLAKRIGQAQLGEHTGLSPALLSKIERGQMFPTLPTLLRISMVFGVGLGYFFDDGKEGPRLVVTRKSERLRLPGPAKGANPPFYFESLDFPATGRAMSSYYAEFPARAAASEAHQHPGSELIYVVGGSLSVTVNGRETLLGTGDATYFDSGVEHQYRCAGDDLASALVVVVA